MIDPRRTLCVVVLLAGIATGCRTTPQAPPAPAAPPASISTAASLPTDKDPPPLSLIDSRLRTAWPDNTNSTAWFGSGGYHLYARTPGEFVAVRAPTIGAVDDVVVTGTFRKVGGPAGGGYGLIVRDRRASAGDGVDQNGQFVVAAVGDRGEMGVWRRDKDRWLDLVPWSPSDAVHQGTEANELRVEVAGSQLQFDVNGVRVASMHSPLPTGRVGVFVGGDLNQVLVERLVVQPLSSSIGTQVSANGAAISKAEAELSALSTKLEREPSSGAAAAQDTRLRDELDDVLQSVQELARDVSADLDKGSRSGVRAQRVAALVGDLEGDVAAALDGFGDGIDSARSPVNNRATLNAAAARLQNAGRTADQILREVQAMHAEFGGGGR